MFLILPNDSEELPECQCDLHTDLIELFVAIATDVAEGYTSAHRVHLDPVGIGCLSCAHVCRHDRIKNAVHVASTIDRLYGSARDKQMHMSSDVRSLLTYTKSSAS